MRIAIAQCAPALGAVKRNVEMHHEWIAKAKAGGAKVVVFPELSLTGYYLKDLAADVACAADDPMLAPIAEASRDIDVIAGFVERSKDAKLHIAQDDHDYWMLSVEQDDGTMEVFAHRVARTSSWPITAE